MKTAGKANITRGQLAFAKRRALNKFDEWNDVTGFVGKHTGYYYEIQSIVEDAVECGAQAACGVEEPLSSEIIELRSPIMEYAEQVRLRTCFDHKDPSPVKETPDP